MGDVGHDDLSGSLLNLSEEQIHRELLESRADIEAGRVISGEIVLAELRRRIEVHFKSSDRTHGQSVE